MVELFDYNYKKNFWIKNTHDIFLGGHATTVVGFNDIKKCFIIRNSWGSGLLFLYAVS